LLFGEVPKGIEITNFIIHHTNHETHITKLHMLNIEFELILPLAIANYIMYFKYLGFFIT
jgi:hypothetical protein